MLTQWNCKVRDYFFIRHFKCTIDKIVMKGSVSVRVDSRRKQIQSTWTLVAILRTIQIPTTIDFLQSKCAWHQMSVGGTWLAGCVGDSHLPTRGRSKMYPMKRKLQLAISYLVGAVTTKIHVLSVMCCERVGGNAKKFRVRRWVGRPTSFV